LNFNKFFILARLKTILYFLKGLLMNPDALTLMARAQYSGQPLVGVNMSGRTFANLSLNNLVFERCSLVGAVFDSVSFSECLFSACDWTGANLANSSFYFCRFEGNMAKVSFRRANFNSSSFNVRLFSEVDFSRASIYEADFGPKAEFMGCVLTSAILGQVKFGQTTILGSRLDYLVIREGSFAALDISASYADHFQGAGDKFLSFKAEDCDWTGANFTTSDLTGARLSGARMVGAYFEGANLTQADLSEAEVERSIFKGANLTGANLTGLKAQYADFSRARLTYALVKGADFSGANFHRAVDLDLRGAALTEGARYTDLDLARAEDFQPRPL
jgi:uncharacterized protein YjbI with pentapeptide repeats